MTTSGFHPAIAATGLRTSFGGKVVLDGIDLQVGSPARERDGRRRRAVL
jgi:hypothetical protein